MKLYALDADYSALTDAEEAILVPSVELSAASLASGTVLRGKLAGKATKEEGPFKARIRVAIGPPMWAASYVYAIGDRVLNDRLKEYVCVTGGTSDTSGGPTGVGDSITDGTVSWDFEAERMPLLDTTDLALGDAAYTDAPLVFDFEVHIRQSRQVGSAHHTWPKAAVASGFWNDIYLPISGPHVVYITEEDTAWLHILYEPELDTGSTTAMTYVLEAI